MRVTIPCSLLTKPLACFLLCASVFLLPHSALAGLKLDLGISGGVRSDNLAWTIAGDVTGNNPNILSELIWSDVVIFQTKIQGSALINDKFFIRAAGAYGEVSSGDNDDFDYAGDDRTFLFSWSHNRAGGRVADLNVGLGSRSQGIDESNHRPWTVNWLAGYSQHEQNMRMTNGFQMFPATGAFDRELNSTYNAMWKGPWLGADVWMAMSEKLAVTLTFEYHLADYTANANWNLRDEFAHPVSYEHSAKGSGIFWSLGANYQVTQPFRIAALLEQHDWATKAGIDRTYFVVNPSTGQPENISYETQLNEVRWESTALMLQAVYALK